MGKTFFCGVTCMRWTNRFVPNRTDSPDPVPSTSPRERCVTWAAVLASWLVASHTQILEGSVLRMIGPARRLGRAIVCSFATKGAVEIKRLPIRGVFDAPLTQISGLRLRRALRQRASFYCEGSSPEKRESSVTAVWERRKSWSHREALVVSDDMIPLVAIDSQSRATTSLCWMLLISA